MSKTRVGDIVVIMEPCYEGCSICVRVIGRTAEITHTYKGNDEVVVQIDHPELLQGGFFTRHLFNTGASVCG